MIGTENLTRALFAHFIRRQEVTRCWRREAGEWVIRDVPFTDDWSEKDYATLFSELRELLSNGGIVIGAFYKGELKGFASVSGVLFGGRREYLDLTNLHGIAGYAQARNRTRALFTCSRFCREARCQKAVLICAFCDRIAGHFIVRWTALRQQNTAHIM